MQDVTETRPELVVVPASKADQMSEPNASIA